MLSGSMSTHADLWTEELQLSGQKFKHLHGLLKHAQFKPLIGQRLWELSEVGTKETQCMACYKAEQRERKRKVQLAEQKGKQTIEQAFAAATAKKQKQE